MHNVGSVGCDECTGCGVCEVACPVQCIALVSDDEGFLRPSVEEACCIGCSKCLNVCPACREPKTGSRKEAVLFRCFGEGSEDSSSGGAAFAIALSVIARGGVVVACAFDAQGTARHAAFETLDELRAMQGSKYVQSDAREGYRLCGSSLEAGREVLFMGTPCQVAAVRMLYGDCDRLLTCDLICHGVPSPGFWAKNLEYQNSRGLLASRKDVLFRSSDRRSRVNFELSTKGTCGGRIPYEKDPYFTLFMGNASLRESCYACSYAREERMGDVTIGDCASRDRYPDFHPCEPVSSVIANTDAGQVALESVLSRIDIDFVPLDFSLEAQLNGQLSRPSPRPGSREDVYGDLRVLDYRGFARKYCKPVTIGWRAKRLVKILIPVGVRVALKRAVRGLGDHGRGR